MIQPLTNVAAILVMMHMALGCHWHHGLGGTHECVDEEVALVTTNGGCGHDHQPVEAPAPSLTLCDDGCHKAPLNCEDDRCFFVLANKFALDMSTGFVALHVVPEQLKSLSKSETTNILAGLRPNAPPLRAHLRLGVLII